MGEEMTGIGCLEKTESLQVINVGDNAPKALKEKTENLSDLLR